MLSPVRFRFLNVERDISSPADWDAPDVAKLWRYNLHYFDDLNAAAAASRLDWHRIVLARWIAENPAARGTGWEPYPLSLRIVNWIKWALAGNAPDADFLKSLAVQIRFLRRRLERHLLGNHLFANAKALVFAGCYFCGEEAETWLRQGMAILEREIPEQILDDGGQFERSPMYHALAFEDMLDLANLAGLFPGALDARFPAMAAWPEVIGKMGRWLQAMCHPDGEIAFFNDAAIGVAPSPGALFAYAERLGFAVSLAEREVLRLDASGYIRIQHGEAVLLIDAAPVGPDYLPGHAHADTLSFELSLFGERVVVNSGTSSYGVGPERERERSTAAHSTVEIDNQNSSEVWAGFRVARRAYPIDVSVRRESEAVIVEAAHDGYRRLPGRPLHRRCWVIRGNRLEVHDRIEGAFGEAVARVHFHPALRIGGQGNAAMIRGAAFLANAQCRAERVEIKPSCYAPEFGVQVRNSCLEMAAAGSSDITFLIEWNPSV